VDEPDGPFPITANSEG